MQPRSDDEQLITDQIRHFARQQLGHFRDNPHNPATARDALECTREAMAMGLFDPDAGGIWQRDDPAGYRQSVLALMVLSEQSPELALHLHQQALALKLMPKPSADDAFERLPWLSLGLGPGFPAAELMHWHRHPNDRAVLNHLADWWLPQTPGCALLMAPDYWQRLLVPAQTRKGPHWVMIRRTSLTSLTSDTLQAPGCWSAWRPEPLAGVRRRLIAPCPPDGYLNLLGLAWLGQLAIALTSVRQAAARAVDYAGQRRQGGVLIRQHGAVQLLLADLDNAIQLTEPRLDTLCELSGTELWLQASQARGALHPWLCRGANAAMQVFGGIGYMQDTGVESLVRINQILAVLHGSPMTMQQLHQQGSQAA